MPSRCCRRSLNTRFRSTPSRRRRSASSNWRCCVSCSNGRRAKARFTRSVMPFATILLGNTVSRASVLGRQDLAFFQVVTSPRGQRLVIGLLLLERALRVVEMHLAFANDFGDGALDDDGGRFVDADAQVLRVDLHEAGHISVAFALGEVLVNGDALEETKAALVAF